MALENTLPELQLAERQLRDKALARYGITYEIREGRPHFAGLRTEADTTLLVKWRDQDVAAARAAAEKRRRAEGGTAVQIKAAGDVAANRAHYRVSSFGVGFHPIGGAFDVHITNPGTSARVVAVRNGAEGGRKQQGGTAVQIKAAGDAAAEREALRILGELAPECGLRWGGAFKDNPTTTIVEQPDPWHFELNQARAVVVQKFATLQAVARSSTPPGSAGTVAVIALLAIGLLWASSSSR